MDPSNITRQQRWAWDQNFRSVVALAPSAYLASAAATYDLQVRLLRSNFRDFELDRALAIWASRISDPTPPVPPAAMRQAS